MFHCALVLSIFKIDADTQQPPWSCDGRLFSGAGRCQAKGHTLQPGSLVTFVLSLFDSQTQGRSCRQGRTCQPVFPVIDTQCLRICFVVKTYDHKVALGTRVTRDLCIIHSFGIHICLLVIIIRNAFDIIRVIDPRWNLIFHVIRC